MNPPATTILYANQQFDPVLQEYYLRARYYDPALGVFGQVDPFPGDSAFPVTLYHYVYGGNDPINENDPSGELLGGFGAALASFSFNLSYSLTTGGIAAEVMLAVTLYSFWEDLELASGIDSETGDSASLASQGMGILFLAFDILPMGKIVRRVLPSWALPGDYIKWVTNLLADHRKNAGKATSQAMSSALLFSEQIIEGTLKVDKAGIEGADIVAEAIEDGIQGVLKREVSVFNGAPGGLYSKIMNHEAGQVKDATFAQVFIQVTDDMLAQPGALDTLRKKAQQAVDDMILTGYGKYSKVYLVDSNGSQLFP